MKSFKIELEAKTIHACAIQKPSSWRGYYVFHREDGPAIEPLDQSIEPRHCFLGTLFSKREYKSNLMLVDYVRRAVS